MIDEVTRLYSLLPEFYPLLEKLQSQCAIKIAETENETALLVKHRRPNRNMKERQLGREVKKYTECAETCIQVRNVLRKLDMYLNGGL